MIMIVMSMVITLIILTSIHHYKLIYKYDHMHCLQMVYSE